MTWLRVSMLWSQNCSPPMATRQPTEMMATRRPAVTQARVPMAAVTIHHGVSVSSWRSGSSMRVTRKSLIDEVPPMTGTPLRTLAWSQSTSELTGPRRL